MNIKSILFGFIALALVFNLHAADRKRSHNEFQEEAIESIKSNLNQALDRFFVENPIIQALLSDEDSLELLMAQISLTDTHNKKKSSVVELLLTDYEIAQNDPIQTIKASCEDLLSPTLISIEDFAVPLDNMGSATIKILNRTIQTASQVALSDAHNEAECLEKELLGNYLTPGLMYAQLLSQILTKTAFYTKAGNINLAIECIGSASLAAGALAEITREASDAGCTSFNNGEDISKLLTDLKAFLVFLRSGFQEILATNSEI